MEFHLLPVFTFLCLALVVSHASLPSEVYWQTVLPNTPMPKAIRDLLPLPGKSTSVDFSNEGLSSISKNGYPLTYSKGNDELNGYTLTYSEGNEELNGYTLTYSEGNEELSRNKINGYSLTYSDGSFGTTSAGEQLQYDLNVAYFFLEKDLHPGSKLKLHFTKITDGVTFLPSEVAESIPFSSNKLPEILNRFSMKAKSAEAQIVKETIEACEAAGNAGENKYCATSLESLIDFTTLQLGKKVQALSTEVKTGTQEYKIGGGVKMVGNNAVACHKLKYAYAVFYCHATQNTRTYMVSLVDADGTKSKAVAICHTDTSTWNPKNLAFRMLKVKPGTIPICHFIPDGHIVWVSN